jgi:ArsR family transcriptional regulator, nickel/cobalt-responsive transcriptional repressor
MTAKRKSKALGTDHCAGRLKALSDSIRLAVLRHLADRPATVTELIAAFGVAQNLMSHHLRVLREAGLVVSRREGKCMRYHVAEGVLGRGAAVIKLGCCDLNFRN